jgi:hypothetical protein
MKRLCYAVAMASLVTPALAQDQSARTIGTKQKAWLVANFGAGLSECAVADGSAVSGSGQMVFDDSDGEGLDLAVAGGDGGPPSVAAHAINTKGTGGSNGRAIEQSCALVVSTHERGSGRLAAAASCSVSGDPDAPSLRFTVPLSAFGAGAAAKNYVGHVTLMKRGDDAAAQPRFMSKKGYDSWKAHSDMGSARGASADVAMTVVAACDTSGLSAKSGQVSAANYDLAVGKKV